MKVGTEATTEEDGSAHKMMDKEHMSVDMGKPNHRGRAAGESKCERLMWRHYEKEDM